MTNQRTNPESPWPHRIAVALVCATFPLIWVGGLVTTYDAGMAVPDWPSTFGYNLFAYPWQTWLLGPWDLFIEHGHRMLGALVGLIAMALVWSVWSNDQRFAMRAAALGALALVILQGGIGGARVLLDERQLAMLHACIGPAFFGYAVALAVFTSKQWKPADRDSAATGSRRLHLVASLTVLFAYFQLILGAQVRHISVMASPSVFRGAVLFHLVMAAVVTFHVFQLAWVVKQQPASVASLRMPSMALVGLILFQLILGCATWVAKYGWPEFMAQYAFAAPYTIQAKSLLQSLIVTSHVATGSLILATAVTVLARSLRVARMPTVALGSSALMMELAT